MEKIKTQTKVKKEIMLILLLLFIPTMVIGNTAVRVEKSIDSINTTQINLKPHHEANKAIKYPPRKQVIMDYVKTETEKAGLRWKDVKCLIDHESNWDEYALLDNSNGAGVDRGLYQFSSLWHPEIKNKDAFDYRKSTEHFIRIVKQDRNYHQWWGFRNGCQ